MPITTDPAAATGLPEHACRNLGEILFEMEDRVANLVRWALVIRDLGTVDGEVEADGLFAIGSAMLNDAKFVEDDWRQCVELTRNPREGDR